MECPNGISQIELTNYCGADCWFCRNKEMTRKRGFMSLELAEGIAKLLENKRVDSTPLFLHYYGESLLHPKLIEIIDIFHKHGIDCGIFTNGVHLTDGLIERLSKSPIKFISITMNRFNPRDRVEKLRYACDNNVYIQVAHLNLPPHKDNYDDGGSKDIAGWAKEVSKKSGKQVHVIGLSYEFPDKVGGKLACSFKTKSGECKLRKRNEYCMLWDGSLVTCLKDFNGETSLGNVLEVFNDVRYESKLCPF